MSDAPYEETLITLELDGVEIDHCIVTGGTWLDAGELEEITKRAGVEPGNLSQALERAKSKGRGPRRCPRCGRKMERVDVGGKIRVEIDRCRRGHGLWFDKGELKALIESYEEGQEGAVARFFADVYRSELQPAANDTH